MLTHDPSAELIHQREKISQFAGALLKFHENVPEISDILLKSIQSVFKIVNKEYKIHADNMAKLT